MGNPTYTWPSVEGLSARDLGRLAEVVSELGEVEGIAAFRERALVAVRRLVDCELAAYNEIVLEPRAAVVVADPGGVIQTGEILEAFAATAHQNPLVALAAHSPHLPAARLSDFLGQRALRRLELYDLVYSKLEVDSQIALSVPVPGRILGITASRGGADFDERELLLFNALRPFLAATLRNVSERARIAATLAALAVSSSAPEAILLADPLGGVQAADERSERWLAMQRTACPRLLAELEGFLRSGAGGAGDLRAASVHGELLVEDRSGRLLVRYVAGAEGQPPALLVERAARAPTREQLVALGLTARQSEVLLLARTGASNAEIGLWLGISVRTVAHHLEHIYGRLGVTTRTAAVHAIADRLRPER
jgi:DNA-binding CsgD family transcriptional regulator